MKAQATLHSLSERLITDEARQNPVDVAVTPAPSATWFATIYDEYASKVYRYIYLRCNDSAIADDLTANVFERVYDHLDGYDP